MRITRRQLRQVIKEELSTVMLEAADSDGDGTSDSDELRNIAAEMEKGEARDIAVFLAGITPENPYGNDDVWNASPEDIRDLIVDEWHGGRMEHLVSDDLVDRVMQQLDIINPS